MKEVRRTLGLVIAAVLVSMMLIGCGDDSSEAEQTVKEAGATPIAEASAPTKAPMVATYRSPQGCAD